MIEDGKASQVHQKMVDLCNTTTKKYFMACLVGYVVAISTTIAVMIIFDHGQPALLYLVPGVILAVSLTALCNGEFKLMWEHSEDKFIGAAEENAEEEKTDEKKTKAD